MNSNAIKLHDDRLAQIARGVNPDGFEAANIAIELQELREAMKKRNTLSDFETDDLIEEIHDRSDALILFGVIDGKEATAYRGAMIELRGLAADSVTLFDVMAVNQIRAKERARAEANKPKPVTGEQDDVI